MPYRASRLSLASALELTRHVPADSGFLCDKPAACRRNNGNASSTRAAVTSVAAYVNCWKNRAKHFIYPVFRMEGCKNATVTLGTPVRPPLITTVPLNIVTWNLTVGPIKICKMFQFSLKSDRENGYYIKPNSVNMCQYFTHYIWVCVRFSMSVLFTVLLLFTAWGGD